MLVASVDVAYRETQASAAAVLFESWTAEEPTNTRVVVSETLDEYEPGQFYKKELPPLLALLAALPTSPTVIVVDGYVWLHQGQARKGLGAHLYDALDGKPTVIGVAKSMFSGTDATAIVRGQSMTPLYVTSIGMPVEAAAANIRAMHGPFRLPSLIKAADRLCRDGLDVALS